MDELAKMCVEASERGAVRWHPERYERTYLDWVRGIRDWCVSRQLWLGHRIPVYTCGNGHQVAAVDPPAACPDCGSSELTEDPDVLDTWFSSALWPFATLGWPDETPEIEAFYPTDLNSTARDIINLWVTRMIFSGLYFTGRAPFSDVQVHATIQAADGRRMSKSLGTGVDPRDVIAEYGADALRAWAAQVGMSSQDVRFDKTRIEGFKRFGNKLWNATRLVLSGLGEDFVRVDVQPDADLALEDRWILSRLQATIKEATEGIEAYSFQRSVDAIYDFAWHEFCDWYLEAAKPRLRDADQRARATAVTVLDALFRLLHPFMPFLSEDLWQRLPRARDDGYLMQQPWPVSDPRFGDGVAEDRFATLMALVEETRAVRHAARAGDRGGRLRALELEPAERELVGAVAAVEMVEAVAADALPLTWGDAALELPARDASRVVTELARLEADLERVEAKLANAAFRERAPAAVVDKEVTKAEELRSAIGRLRAGLA
jgi:valyl-tRNA synthetase